MVVFDNAVKLLDWFKSPTRWVGLLLLCTALLFFPQTWLQKFGLFTFVQSYRAWIAFAGLFAATVLSAEFLSSCSKLFRRWFMERRKKRIATDYLQHLTVEEKGTLMYYMANDTETNYLDSADG